MGSVAAMIVVGSAIGACGDTSTDAGRVVGHGDARFPYDELRDWVSYADAVVRIDVQSVEVDDVDETTRETGAGLLERQVFADVTEVVWAHPAADRPPRTIEFVGLPYVVRDGKPLESRMGIAPWIESGESFVVPIALTADSGWVPLNVEAAMPLVNGLIAPPDDGDHALLPFAGELAGVSLREAGDLLAGTAPDPIAEEHRDLGPDERYAAVVHASR